MQAPTVYNINGQMGIVLLGYSPRFSDSDEAAVRSRSRFFRAMDTRLTVEPAERNRFSPYSRQKAGCYGSVHLSF